MSALPAFTSARITPAPAFVEFPAYLGKELRIEGIVDTDGEIYVHGYVGGRINADRVLLSPGGYVEGDIVAREVRIAGRLSGRIFSLNVMLYSTAEVSGRIFHHTVTIEKGARINARMPWRPLNFFQTLDQLPETWS